MDAQALWLELFGNDNPVEVEIGSGTGAFLMQASLDHPATNYFAIEHARSRAAELSALIRAAGRTNARAIAADAACVIREIVPRESVAAFHIYFPDPWWKRRHHRRRLFTPEFARNLARGLVPGGRVYTATDVAEVFDLIRRTMKAGGVFVENPEQRSPRRQATSFERKGTLRGAMINEMCFRKKTA